jgi:hypothetical protein
VNAVKKGEIQNISNKWEEEEEEEKTIARGMKESENNKTRVRLTKDDPQKLKVADVTNAER